MSYGPAESENCYKRNFVNISYADKEISDNFDPLIQAQVNKFFI